MKDAALKNYISGITETVKRCYRECEGSCPLCENDKCQCEKAKNVERLKELAEYRRLEEEGLLLRLPCCDWVSVKDRLPEKAGKYLVTITEGGSVHTTVRRFNPKPKHPEQTEPLFTRHLPYRSGWERATCGVTAWAELPEPYKEG